MPSVDEIRTITIQAVSDGLDKAVSDINNLAAAQGNLAVVSDSSTRAQTSVANALERQQTSLDTTYRAQKTFNTSQLAITTGFNEGLISVDRYNQLMALAGQRFDDATKKASPLEKTFDGLKDKATEVARELGPMGTALTAIGPAGLAIGAAIGVAILALDKLKDQANEAGQWAQQLQNAANIIGLNTTQLQALNEAGIAVGVSANDNVTAFERFAVSLGQLREGSGTLYAQLLKVNPALVNQLSVTKDAATGWNLLAQAYAQADKQQQALISRAAFGRGGAAEGGVLLATAAVGGIGGLANENAVSQQQIQQWATLTAQINQATEAASHNFQSIFTTSVLTGEKNFANGLLAISQYAKAFQFSDDFKSFINFMTSPGTLIVLGALATAAAVASGGTLLALAGVGLAGAGTYGAVGTLGAQSRAQRESALPPPPNFDATFSAVAKSNSDQAAASMGVQATQAKALVAALGSVATAQERLDATTKSLNVELANHTITQETYNRAVAGARLDAAISQQNALNSALGASTPIADLVAAKQLQLQKVQQQGVSLTQAQIDNQLRLTASQALGTFQISAQIDAENVKINMLGMSTQAGIAYQIVQTKINEAIALGKPLNDQEIAQLQQKADALAKVKTMGDQLTSLKTDAQDFTTTFVNGLMQGKSAMESLSAAATQLSTKLADKAITDLFSGNLVQAGIEAVAAAGSYLIGKGTDDTASKALKDAQKAFADMAVQVVNFNEAAKGFNLGPLTNELQSLLSSYTQIQLTALKAGNTAAAADASRTFGQGVERIVQQFKDGTPVLTPYADAVKKLSDEEAGLYDTLISLKDYTTANEVAISLGAQLTALAKQFVQSFSDGLQARINTAQGNDYLNQIASTITQHQQDILEAQQLGISPDLVNKTFDAEIQKIIDDAGLVGDSFNDFIKQFPQFAGAVTESSTALQAANDKFKQLTETISTYLNSLALGSNSTLSPQQQLQLAQSNFQQQFSLAAGGDQTALGSITQYADAYLNAGKGFYASSGGYSDIYNAVTSALQALIGAPSTSSLTGSSLTSVPPSIGTGSSIPGVIMPQTSVASAANDNGALFQTQTTALSQVFTNVGQAQIVALQAGVADLKAELKNVTSAIQANKPKALRPNQKGAFG